MLGPTVLGAPVPPAVKAKENKARIGLTWFNINKYLNTFLVPHGKNDRLGKTFQPAQKKKIPSSTGC